MLLVEASRPDSERYSCPSCSKSFVRKAHMLRHQQQHASQKPFLCTFCSKSFKRSDVLRAHQFRCKERGDAPVPEGQSKGRKRSSCTSCVKLRTKCDQETPCGRCQELGKDCHRESGSARSPENNRPRHREAIPIHHLLNTPPNDDFCGRFPIRDVPIDAVDDEDDNGLVDQEDSSDASHWSEDGDPYDPYIGADLTFESFFGGLETMTFGTYPMYPDTVSRIANPGTSDAASLTLEPRAAEVRQALHMTTHNFSSLPEATYMTALNTSIDYFTGAMVDNLLNLYFKHYHRHCPVIHRPSFQPTTAPLALVLSVMALGGMYSQDPGQVQWMRSLLDVMEGYIFSLPGIRDEFMDSLNLAEASNEDILQSQFEIFQGAYLIVIAQYFSGNLAAKRRARRQRFTRVLDIARSFKLPTSQHGRFVAIPDEAAFRSWIRLESRIRQMNIMLAFDAAMAIFNNVPPRVSFGELDLQLPCDPQYFELSSYSEMLSRSTFPKPKMRVLDAFQKLFIPSISDLRDGLEKDSLNCWDMLFLVHCLYTHVWRQTFSNPLLRSSPSTLHAPGVILEPLKTAIRNWKLLWDEIRAGTPREATREMGFETSADSYWTLTKLIVQRFENRGTNTTHNNGNGNGSGIKGESRSPMTTISENGFNDNIGNDMIMGGGGSSSSHSTSAVAAGAGITAFMGGGGGTFSAMSGLDFMPIETDCDNQGAHLRKILKRAR